MFFLCFLLRRSLFLLFSDTSEDVFFDGFSAVVIPQPPPCDGALAVFGEVAPSATALGDFDVVFLF